MICPSAALAFAAAVASLPLPRLRDMAPTDLHMGAAMHYDSVQNGTAHPDAGQYARLQALQFGMAQDKNCMNWAFVEYSTRGRFRWGPADDFVAWCTSHATLVRGHGLVWGAHLPAWLLAMAPPANSTNITNATAASTIRSALNTSLSTMVDRYRGRVHAWHVVLEPFGDPHWKQPLWKPNLLYATFGEGYIARAFAIARAADPLPKLCLLDYQIAWGMYTDGSTGAAVWDHAKADVVYATVQGFKSNASSSLARNLDCVCMESHLQPHVAANRTGYEWLRHNFDRYHAIGVEVHINALTISVDGFNTSMSMQDKFEAQATWYGIFLKACLDSPACTDFEPYGLTDKYDMGTTPIYSLPFDADYKPKAAFWAMVSVLNGSFTPPEH